MRATGVGHHVMVGEKELSAIAAKMSGNIKKYGWSVQMVLPGADTSVDPSFAYTIGMTETYAHPEFLLIGFEPSMMQSLLNAVGKAVKGGQRFEDWGLSEQVLVGFPVYFREVGQDQAGRWARASQARYEKTGFRLLQMFLPDAAGQFPWDAGCDPSYVKGQGHLMDSFVKAN